MELLITISLLLSWLNFIEVSTEYCYYRQAKEGEKNYLDCKFIERDEPIEGISLVHLQHNTTILVLEKSLLAPFKNLKTLYITAANIERIEPGALQNNKLEMIDFYHNNLKTIENGTFNSQNVLKVLDISYNKFESLTVATFSDLLSLEWLSMTSNNIKTIGLNTFSNLKNLKALFLNFNKIQELEPGTFQSLINLEYLDLSYNSLKNIQFGLFSQQQKLKHLDLQHNYLKNLPDHVFDNMTSLTVLNISHNEFKTLQENLFINTNELEILKINDNLITDFNVTSLLSYTPELKEIYMYHNEWKCDHIRKMFDSFIRLTRFVQVPASTRFLKDTVNGIGCHK